MNNRSIIVGVTIALMATSFLVFLKTRVTAPEIDMSEVKNGPANILPISIDVATNQDGRKVLLVNNGALTFDGVTNVPMFAEGTFPITFEDELGATVAQGLAGPKGEWMTTKPVQFTASLQVKPITEPVIGNLVFKRDNLSGLPEHDFELKLPAVLQNK